MKKICLFGANGNTGKEIIKKCLNEGIEVIGAVRRAKSLRDFSKHVDIREYSFQDKTSVSSAMQGSDAIVIAIGSENYSDAAKPTTLYSNSIRTVLDTMQEKGIKRLLAISSAGTEYDQKAPWYYRYFFGPWLMNSYMDMMKMETVLEKRSAEFQWTM